jgi:hypothetical protein
MGVLSFCQEKPGKTANTLLIKSDTLIVQARLLEIPVTFPSNDIYNYVYIFKYRVLKVEKGTYNGQDILVGQYNPLIPRSQIKDKMDLFVNGDVRTFEAGARHRLTLVSPMELVWKDAVEDEFFDLDSTRYFSINTEDVKK